MRRSFVNWVARPRITAFLWASRDENQALAFWIGREALLDLQQVPGCHFQQLESDPNFRNKRRNLLRTRAHPYSTIGRLWQRYFFAYEIFWTSLAHRDACLHWHGNVRTIHVQVQVS
jgi:hypothetical protein